MKPFVDCGSSEDILGPERGKMNRQNFKRPKVYLMREEDWGLASPAGGRVALLRESATCKSKPSAPCLPGKHPTWQEVGAL